MPALARLQSTISRPITDRRNWSTTIKAAGGLTNWWSTVRGTSDVDQATNRRRFRPREGFAAGDLVMNAPIAFADTGYRPWRAGTQVGYSNEFQLPNANIYSFIFTSSCTVNFSHGFAIRNSAWGNVPFTLRPTHNGAPTFTKGSSFLFRSTSLSVALDVVSTIAVVVDCSARRVSMAVNGGAFVTSDVMTGTDLVAPAGPVALIVGAMNNGNTFSGDIMEMAVGVDFDLRTNLPLWQQFRAYATEIWGNP